MEKVEVLPEKKDTPKETKPKAEQLKDDKQEVVDSKSTQNKLEISTDDAIVMTDETAPDTPRKPASEKYKYMKEAAEYLTTVLYNSTRKGLNEELKALNVTQKHKLFRNFAKNFPLKWCEKFDQDAFIQWRLEYAANYDLDEDEFEELAKQAYMKEEECCGNYEMLVCLSGSKNDEKNAELKDDRLAQKSQQCRACYWYNTAMNIVTDGPSFDDSEELQQLMSELDDNLDLFKHPAEQYFVNTLFSQNLGNFMKGLK